MSGQSAQPGGKPEGDIGTAWTAPKRGQRSAGPGQPDPWVSGGVLFAGVLLLCNGVLAVLQGIAAVAGDDVYGRIGSYVYELDLTGWGWIHIVLGVLVAVTGAGLLKESVWARPAGVFLAALSLVAQFLFLPYAPIWSMIMMAIDVFIIWALVSRMEHAG
ncbi:hypothetical protein ABZZ79_09540 [Streptomyces sp. NPDC006458]|uniref:DUF7144 family membrane protein n=1 Tax=Streptomyces sp. NPDC006458 TaxID=3154302 RepID=UPI0033B7E1C7